jgi:hypothetical protein
MPLHFKTEEGYRKYEAYKHMHHLGGGDGGKIWIAGHLHHVNHTRKKTGI